MRQGWTPVEEVSAKGWTPVAETPRAQTTPARSLKPSQQPTVKTALAALDSYERERRTAGANIVPAVLGMAGGMVGGVPGAAIGGVVGDAVRQSVRRETGAPTASSPKDQARSMAVEGGLQGAGQLVGTGAAKVAAGSARFLMNRAANVTDRLAREFPGLSDTLVKNAIAVSQGGYEKARGLLVAAKARATTAVNLAERQGLKVSAQLTPDIADSFKTAILESAMKAGSAKPTGKVLTVATERLNPQTKALLQAVDDAVAQGEPFELTPSQADMLKTQLQKESKRLYLAMRAPNGTPAIEADAALKADYAAELNTMIDDIAAGYKLGNAKAREFIGATRAVQQAVRPGKNLYMALVRPTAGMVAGGVVGGTQDQAGAGALAGAALGTPRGMSSMAIGLGNPVVQELLKQLPRGLATAISATLQSREQSAGQTPR